MGDHSAHRDTSLRRDVQEAIDRIWPDGIVEMPLDLDESYFFELHPKLSRDLHHIRNTRLVYEREADGGPVWWEESDPEEDPPDEIERSRSYHTFFVSPDGKGFTFETEAEGITEPEFMTDDFAEIRGEDPPVTRISGSGRNGWVVAVSLLAPFAVIELGETVAFEDGNTTEAEIESYGQAADGELIDPEKSFQKVSGARVYKTIMSLRTKIADILGGFGMPCCQRMSGRSLRRGYGAQRKLSSDSTGKRSACWTRSFSRASEAGVLVPQLPDHRLQ